MSPLSDFAPQTAYDSLLIDAPQWYTFQYGTGCCLGFKGEYEAIQKCLTLFANFDFNDKTKTPREDPEWLAHDFAYLTTSNQRIHAALSLFFFCEILRLDPDLIKLDVEDADPANEDESWLAGVENKDWPGPEDYTDAACAFVEGRESGAKAPVVGKTGIVYHASYDEAEIAEMAEAYATRFMDEVIQVKTFLPPTLKADVLIEHGMGSMVDDSQQGVLETLVEEAAK